MSTYTRSLLQITGLGGRILNPVSRAFCRKSCAPDDQARGQHLSTVIAGLLRNPERIRVSLGQEKAPRTVGFTAALALSPQTP